MNVNIFEYLPCILSNTSFIVKEKSIFKNTHDRRTQSCFLKIKTQNEKKKKIVNHVININLSPVQYEKMAAKANTYDSHNRSVISKAKEGDLLEIYRGYNSHWAVYIGE